MKTLDLPRAAAAVLAVVEEQATAEATIWAGAAEELAVEVIMVKDAA